MSGGLTGGPDAAFDRLTEELSGIFATDDVRLSEEAFDRLALRVFSFQCRACPTYGAFAAGRGALPDRVEGWRGAPAVPTSAFKTLELTTAPPERSEAIFRTSGTTLGAGSRGRHHVRSLALYRASLLPTFRRHLLPDRVRPPLLSLVPSPALLPDSSLSYMIGAVAEELCEGARWFVGADGSVDVEAFRGAAAIMRDEGEPVLVVGTALSYLRLVEGLGPAGAPLPSGSRLMETGGFKRREGEISQGELYAALSAAFGLPEERIVNEYGMTELLSQLYEETLTRGREARGRLVPPPWLRVRALDPATLEERAPGASGLLSFFDLANLGSVSAVLTEDVGVVSADGSVRLEGRAGGAEPRGCSLALEDLVSAAGAVG